MFPNRTSWQQYLKKANSIYLCTYMSQINWVRFSQQPKIHIPFHIDKLGISYMQSL